MGIVQGGVIEYTRNIGRARSPTQLRLSALGKRIERVDSSGAGTTGRSTRVCPSVRPHMIAPPPRRICHSVRRRARGVAVAFFLQPLHSLQSYSAENKARRVGSALSRRWRCNGYPTPRKRFCLPPPPFLLFRADGGRTLLELLKLKPKLRWLVG